MVLRFHISTDKPILVSADSDELLLLPVYFLLSDFGVSVSVVLQR